MASAEEFFATRVRNCTLKDGLVDVARRVGILAALARCEDMVAGAEPNIYDGE